MRRERIRADGTNNELNCVNRGSGSLNLFCKVMRAIREKANK